MMTVWDWKDTTKKSYDTHAREFANYTSIFRGKLGSWIHYFTSQFMPRSIILDVGCGAGRDAKFFLDCGLQVIGIDLSEKLIEIAKKNISNARFYVMDFERLVFPKEKFDGVWASASLVHLPKERLQHVIGDIHQILRKDGLFFSSFRVGAGERFTEERRGKAILKRFYSYYKPEEVRQALMKAKFTIQDEERDSINSGDWIFFLARK